MVPTKWDQILDLFHAAREKSFAERVKLLDRTCGEDTPLRKAVETLLKEDEAADGFLSTPVFESIAGKFPESGIAPGQSFGRYVVCELLGRGGMGEVWSARDTTLDRPVALKFLSSKALAVLDGEQITREAKAASALNHPNIVTIHEVVQSESTFAIVMELVDGNSLRQLIGRPLLMGEVLEIGSQIARALAAAHGGKIVHGDIKPENILLRRDRYVKVLDFGLARTGSADTIAVACSPRLGTLRYMSPEQARGESLTPASDIFSFGLVLYELATGRHAFPAGSPLDTAHAILTQDPPPGVNSSVPAPLDSLIQAMLAKQPAGRPSAEEVTRQLYALEFDAQGRLRHGGLRLATMVTVVAAVVILGWFLFRRSSPTEVNDLKIQPLTSQWGWEGSPALSPDGKSVVFTWTDRLDRPEQIYLKVIGAEHLKPLTAPQGRSRIAALVWSPDARRIAFKRSAELYKHPGAIYSVAPDGGTEEKIVELNNANLSSAIDWSPDGAQLAYSDAGVNPDQLAIYLFNLKTGQKRRLTSPPKSIWGDWDPKFSPDGLQIAFKRVTGLWADDIYVTKLAGAPLRRVTTGVDGIGGHAWTAHGEDLIVSCQRGSSSYGLWRFPMTTDRPPQRLILGPGDAMKPAINRNTNLIAWVNQFSDQNIYRVSAKGNSPPEKLIASTFGETEAIYSSTSQIAFLTNRSGNGEIWIADPVGSVQIRATNFSGSHVADPRWSHNGQRLAYQARTHGIPSVFMLNCNAQDMHCNAPTLLSSLGSAEVPSWSADDRFLYFASDRSGRSEIYKQAIEGGPVKQVTHNGGYFSRESPDGKWLYFTRPEMAGVWRMAPGTSPGKPASAEELVIGPPYNPPPECWTQAGDEIVFIDRPLNTQPAAIRAYNIVTKRVRLIVSLKPYFFDANDTRVSVSPDLRWVLYSQADESVNKVMLAENMK